MHTHTHTHRDLYEHACVCTCHVRLSKDTVGPLHRPTGALNVEEMGGSLHIDSERITLLLLYKIKRQTQRRHENPTEK